MNTHRIACELPFYQRTQEKQTNVSIVLRTAAVALGIITAVVGILILFGVPGLSHLDTTVGWITFSIGAFLTLVGASIKCIKKQSNCKEKTQSKIDSNEIKPLNSRDLKQISKNTLDLMQQGYYTNSLQKKIPLQSGLALHKSSQLFEYKSQDVGSIQQKYAQKVLVLEKDCLEVAQEFAERGNKVVVLNFAGPEEVGGGFLDGTAGQEEKLIYRSDLAALMKYYHDIQDNAQPLDAYPLYEHLMHTPEVTIFRDSSFAVLDKPFKVGILTSAAPVPKPTSAPTAFETIVSFDGTVDYADERTKVYLKDIIFTQLKVGYDAGYETIILGAFGCGAFKNPPQAVAKIYHQIINSYFIGAFKEIIFAILDDGRRHSHNPSGNILPFKGYFPDVLS